MKKKAKTKSSVVLDIKEQIPDPQKFPWPYKDGSVSEITCANVFEYIPGKLRGKFMDEIFRILEPAGKATFIARYWNTAAAMQDYRYEWPPLTEQSFLYFNKGWRAANGLQLGIACDFDFTYGYSVDTDTANRNDETRAFSIKNYNNIVNALQVSLVKR